jgi:hypothetical protein
MRELHLNPTKSTPTVDFIEGSLHISGEAFPEDTMGFFTSLLDWITEYAQSEYCLDTSKETLLYSNIDYFNTGSRPYVIEMVVKLNDLHKTGHKVNITWHYDADEGIEEDDVNFADFIDNFKIKVAYIPKKIGS